MELGLLGLLHCSFRNVERFAVGVRVVPGSRIDRCSGEIFST
jgi:hypothetical protein